MSSSKTIVVIIPARNEEAYLKPTIRSIKGQSIEGTQILVVDSASTDETNKVAIEEKASVVRLNLPGVARARNAGGDWALKYGADLLVFVDADSLLQPGLLEEISKQVFEKNKKAGTCRISLDKSHWRAKLTEFVLNALQRIHRAPHSMMFALPEVFAKVRFDESMVMAEDEKWAYQVMKDFGPKSYKLITKLGVTTSARRFEKLGYWHVIYKWWTNLPWSLSDKEKHDTYFDTRF